MVNTVVANVFRQGVATDDPLRRLDEQVAVRVGLANEMLVLRTLQHWEDHIVEALALDGVLLLLESLLEKRLHLVAALLEVDSIRDKLRKQVVALLRRSEHAVDVRRVVLEQRVAPRRPATICADRERIRDPRPALSRRAARRVRGHEALTEQLREKHDQCRLVAALARA